LKINSTLENSFQFQVYIYTYLKMARDQLISLPNSCSVCLDLVKNNVRIEKLRIVNENSVKIVIFRLAQGWWKSNVILNGRNIFWNSDEELRKITTNPSPTQNNIIITILIISK
jgi:hypothetical protein